jgi:hypothetical protein
MMVGQGMGGVLTKLNGSPAIASRFGDPNGVEFEDISFDKCRLWMVIDDDIVTVRMRIGSFGKKGKISFEKVGQMDED